ncbi:MAG: baseplate wedge protein 53 [Endozoicomonadaceae bacterium]|nr:baseplate wedge protein 53 [Endozoicomonadaceae bacterium]
MTSYFKNFPTIFSQIGNNQVLVTDITKNVRIRNVLMKNIISFDEYVLRDGETPEDVSFVLYDTTDYYWIVMLVNERFDRIYDFVMTPNALNKYVKNKYKDKAESVRYYVDLKTGIQTSGNNVKLHNNNVNLTAITNRKYEEMRNESNRLIKIPSAPAIEVILRQFRGLI